MAEIHHILTTTDFSEAAEPGIEQAIALAKQLGARLTLVHVFDAGPLAPLATRGDVALHQYVDEQEVERAARDALESIRARKLRDLPDARAELVAGHEVSKALDDYVHDNGVDLIVLSTHGRTGIPHLLIGSVAERLVRHSRCPVLTVPSRNAI